MTRRLLLCSVIAAVLAVPVWWGRTTVAAGPKLTASSAPVPTACKDDLARVKAELASARDAQKRAEAAEAAARAELEKMKVTEVQRLKRLEQQTGVAADKLR